VLGALPGCLGPQHRAVPLYARAASPLPREAVARLQGPIASVDGHEVPGGGNAFELLPGCHIVEIGGRVGRFDPQYGGWVASLPALAYAFPMRANYTYSIDIEADPAIGVGPTGTGRIVARELDDRGRSRVISPLPSGATIDGCNQASALAKAPPRGTAAIDVGGAR
jgi:hypothetical protein